MNKRRVTDLPGNAARPIGSLTKGLLILEAFTADKPEWGVRELARALKVNPASVHRLATTLCSIGFLEQDPSSRRYSLGPRVMKLAGLYTHHNPLPGVALRVFEKYIDRFEHSFYLIALARKFEAVYLAVLEGRAPVRVTVEPGGFTGLHSTAAGRVLLSHQPEDYIAAFISLGNLKAFTPRTITSPETLRQELVLTRERGYAINDGEQFEDVGAVAVPVYDRDGKATTSVSLAYPRHLVKEARLDLDSVIRCAREIADEIMLRAYGSLRGISLASPRSG